LDGAPLKLQFSRLYELSVHKECSVEDMARLGWEEGGNAWGWRRRLLAWEDDSVRECSVLLNNVILQENFQDHRRSLLDPIHGYSARDLVNPQVHGSTKVVKREYRSNRELLNYLSFLKYQYNIYNFFSLTYLYLLYFNHLYYFTNYN